LTTRIKGKNGSWEETWFRDVELIYTGNIGNLYRFQLLCLDMEHRSGDYSPEIDIKKQLACIFDDVRLSVNEKGEIVKVNNRNQLQERQKKEYGKLKKHNDGYVLENYFRSLEALLEDEQETINFLSDYKMYGMIFNGISFSTTLNETTYRRKVTLPDFFGEDIIEENGKAVPVLKPGQEKPFSVTGKIAEKQEKEDTQDSIQYQGEFIYNGNLLVNGILDIENNNHKIKYSILWVG
jgi:hypothetical protein